MRATFVACLLALVCVGPLRGADDPFAAVERDYREQARPLIARFCLECHSTAAQEGDLDLEQFADLTAVRRSTAAWLKVAEMLDNGEMPPKEAEQPAADERRQLRGWLERYLNAEAAAHAGDPGPVVLRRLNNAQYTYTVQDLTGVALEPAREFPPDSAAGEGFTNTGAALAMSPSLLTKYFDAGKELAAHAVLLPDGMRFSRATSRRDWTDEILAGIRDLYRRYTDAGGASSIDLHGLHWESNAGGRLPAEAYLTCLLAHRESLAHGTQTPADVARERGLNARYTASLWQVLNAQQPSQLIGQVQRLFRAAQEGEAGAVQAEVARWQASLFRFQSVGHMKNWMVHAEPLAASQEVRWKFDSPAAGDAITLYLVAGEAGDGAAGDTVQWQRPRLVFPGREDVPLREVRALSGQFLTRRTAIFAATAAALAAADDISQSTEPIEPAAAARKHGLDAGTLSAWLDYLGIGSSGEQKLALFTERLEESAGYTFVQGWGSTATPSLVANASDQHVRIPGNMKPHGVVVHPSPTLWAATGWRSPIAGAVRVAATVTRAHPECGNGVTWKLELRRGHTRQALARGEATGTEPVRVGPFESLNVRRGDLLSLAVGPREGNHACDLTDVELTIEAAGGARWSLAADITPDVLAGNPHADRHGNAGVWHFYTEPVGDQGGSIPPGSLVARWQTAASSEERGQLAEALARLLATGPPADAAHPDAVLYRQLASFGGPLFSQVTSDGALPTTASKDTADGPGWGLDAALFGRRPDGTLVEADSLCVAAPSIVEVRLPADLVAGAEFVATGVLDPQAGSEGSVQLSVGGERPAAAAELRSDLPVVTAEDSDARRRFQQAFADFRQWFPPALCYVQIVPVDEVVTLTLFHREDEPLRRLMLDEAEAARLERLWNELHFVSQDALMLVDAFAQLMEYATQDGDPALFEPYRQPIHDAAAAHHQAILAAQPAQLDALIAFAEKAYRRPLEQAEEQALRALYERLRTEELPHEEALRFTLARVFVAPAFLYRLEQAPPGDAPAPVTAWELANRLSYFLWSSAPDDELRSLAASGELARPEVLAAQVRRMLGDGRIRRLASEFAAQWLHVYEFDKLDEKSDRHFPEFAQLRGAMYEEPLRFFTDLFQRDGSVLSILDADHTFVNGPLAEFYGIGGVSGEAWQRVEGIGRYQRGGVLGMAAVLAKHSGASRTSPTLRGNWIAEVLLADKLPKPPKDVPVLPDDEAALENLTVRQLVERHAADARCAGCHVRVDPLGFALEAFDAVGRHRERDLAGRPIDAHTRLADGSELSGIAGLRDYLLTRRRDAVLDQFCRKLLGFALGRGVQLSDLPLVTEMRRNLAARDFRFSAAVETIVHSRQFLDIRGRDARFAEAAETEETTLPNRAAGGS